MDEKKVVAKNGPFSLKFCQIVALMSPHRGAAAGEADLLLSFDSQATAIEIGGAVGAIGTACAVRIVDVVGRKLRAVPAVGVTGRIRIIRVHA